MVIVYRAVSRTRPAQALKKTCTTLSIHTDPEREPMTTHKHKQNQNQKHRHGAHAGKQPVTPPSRRPSPSSVRSNAKQYLIVAGLAAAAFFGAYTISNAVNGTPASVPGAETAASGSPVVTGAPPIATTTAPTNQSAAPAEGAAVIENGVQKISVEVGFEYSPSVIRLKAGVPAEITFGEGQGCTAVVQSQQLGFEEDLSTGAKTVKLQGLQPGTYGFACGMDMVRGQIIVS